MLVHIGQGEAATRVHNAWLRTIEDGIHTYDIFDPSVSKTKVGTAEFAEAVIARMGETPTTLKAVEYSSYAEPIRVQVKERTPASKELVGMDVFLDWRGPTDELGRLLEENSGPELSLVMISNRGQKVYPGGLPETFCVDHWRCRFQAVKPGDPVSHRQIIDLLSRLNDRGLEFIKTEGLFTFDGLPGFSLGQGQ
jgi:isocitrate dehydrogenase